MHVMDPMITSCVLLSIQFEDVFSYAFRYPYHLPTCCQYLRVYHRM